MEYKQIIGDKFNHELTLEQVNQSAKEGWTLNNVFSHDVQIIYIMERKIKQLL